MQANTRDRALNMQVFAGLLRCIRKICNERFIGHIAIVGIQDVSQIWYSDFFRLAGFHPCHCQSSAGSTPKLETRICLASRESPAESFPTVYEMFRIWLAEGRCTKALLDSIASGEGAEVEHRYFHDLLTEFENETHSQSAQANTKFTARDQTHSQMPWQESMRTSAAPKRKVLKPRSRALSLRKQYSSQDVVVKNMDRSVFRARKKRKRGKNILREGFWRGRRAQVHQS